MTTTGTTTERMKRRGRTSVSARWRITAWILLITLLVLVLVFVIVRNLLLRDVNVRANGGVAQEAAEFRRFADEGVDPTTTRPFDSVERLLEVYLSRQTALQGEVMVGLTDTHILELPGGDWPGDSPAHRDVLQQIVDSPESAGVVATSGGDMRWGKVPIDGPVLSERPAGAGSGMFIVGVSTEPGRTMVTETMRTLVLVGLGGLLATTGVAYFVAGRILAPVRSVRRVAGEIGETDLTARVPVEGNDDIADLARTFNSMLDRLENAYRIQQQFVDDAGHELRTPITVIRGHLELLPDDPVERRASLDLVDSELMRMSRIVNDLLMLAKSEQPDFVVPRETDVATLTLDIESKVSTLAEREWLLMEVAEGTAALDPDRITQAMLQLAANAVDHTDDGSGIRLGSRFAGDGPDRRLSIWITDEGPGVTPEQAPKIFERFHRGPGTAGTTRRPGAGLGLAIVRAIADGHHGGAWVRSTPGQGATFGLDLPAPRVHAPGPVDAGIDTRPTTGDDAAPTVAFQERS